MVTKECSKQFKNWLIKNSHIVCDEHLFIMQYGLYEQFFLENNIIMDLMPMLDYDGKGYTKVLGYNVYVFELGSPTVDENSFMEIEDLYKAKRIAVETANKIYNEE